MRNEPTEMPGIRRSRSTRHDAVLSARRVVDGVERVERIERVEAAAVTTDDALDEAFAELPPAASPGTLGDALVGQIASQLKQLDAQRDKLRALLDEAKS